MGLLEQRLGRVPLLHTFRSFAEAGNCNSLAKYPLWISDPDSPAGHPIVPGPWHDWAIQQYETTGDVDRDVARYRDLAAMIHALGKPPAWTDYITTGKESLIGDR